MDNFTLEELQQMIVEQDSDTVLVSAEWVHINASNEGVYYAVDTDGDAGHIYVHDLGANGFSLNITCLVNATDVVTEYPPAYQDE